MSKSRESQFQLLKSMIDSLTVTFGKNCEFVIHDFSNPAHSLIHIAGNVTKRSVGAPLTDRLLQAYREAGDAVQDILNVQASTSDGRPIRTSSIFIRDVKGKVIGSLGVNIDLTEYEFARRVLEDICQGERQTVERMDREDILFPSNVNEVVSMIINEAFQRNNLATLMDKEERKSLVRELERKGVFLMKGAVEEVASRLGVSRFSIYNYLDEIRREQKQRKNE
ncbi:MAG: helix-turn-helix transcriptional regulator [Desulfitobacteriaceae bacterium]